MLNKIIKVMSRFAKVTITAKNWSKVNEEMFATLPREEAAQAMKIFIKYVENR